MRQQLHILAFVGLIVPCVSARAQSLSSSSVAVHRAPVFNAAICDGSAITNGEHRRMAGNALLIGAAGVGLLGLASHQSAGTTVGTFSVGVGMLAAGAFLHWSSHPNDAFWDDIVARAKPGETTTADVRTCLHSPDATSVGTREEEWTYFMRRPWLEAGTHSYRSVSFTFKSDTLVDVRRRELRAPDEGRVPAVPVPGR
jgi:hypothetical protein